MDPMHTSFDSILPSSQPSTSPVQPSSSSTSTTSTTSTNCNTLVPTPAPTPMSDIHPTPPPPTTPTEKALLSTLRHALTTSTRQATFTCGGTLPVHTTTSGRLAPGTLTPILDAQFGGHRKHSRGCSIRWDRDGMGKVLSFPMVFEEEGEGFRELLEACAPATFGRGGEDVLDETYRRARALGAQDFMTDFCPYREGIVDSLVQYLLPPITGDLRPLVARSEVSEVYDLSQTQEREIERAICVAARTRDEYVNTLDLPAVLAKLQILPEDSEDLQQILLSLDPATCGLVRRPELVDLLAARLIAHPPPLAPENQHLGLKDPHLRMLSRGLRVELYKLNVYSGPSGHFKPHVDTPRSDSQIGSLVVNLPVRFTGGRIAVRHSGREVGYKWDCEEPAIRWAAFYSDCEHEVLPVTSGHRVTLTYNLFMSPGTGLLNGVAAKALDAGSMPLSGLLRRMLGAQTFMPLGGYLGIHLAHAYPHTDEVLHKFVPRMLKGGDMALYETVLSLRLAAALEPVSESSLPEEGLLTELAELEGKEWRVVSRLREHMIEEGNGPDEMREDSDEEVEEWEGGLEDEFDGGRSYELKKRIRARERVTWVSEGEAGNRGLKNTFVAYGNESTLGVKYSHAALVVKIPEWDSVLRREVGM